MMKYREIKNLRISIVITFVMVVIYLSILRNLDYNRTSNINVVYEHYIFNKMPPARNTARLKFGTRRKVFQEYIDWTRANIEEKLQRWENEYMYRSLNEHLPTKQGIYDVIKKHKRGKAVWVDSGGHVGDTSIPVLLRLWDEGIKDSRLVIVEPDESKCLWIKRNLLDLNSTQYPGIFEMVTVVNTGIWSHKTRAILHRSHVHPGGWSVVSDETRFRQYTRNRTVNEVFTEGEIPLLSIKDILKPDVNFLLWHLDVEGSEERAFLGLLQTHFQPVIIYESFKDPYKDFLFGKDLLVRVLGYSLHTRFPPNMDRLMIPKKIQHHYSKWEPDYV